MQQDPRREADVLSWLQKARGDLRCAEIDLAALPPATEDALFHCQQAVEKSLKAFLVWHDEPFGRSHDLGRLGKRAAGLDPTLEPLVEQVVELTKYAWILRYPGSPVRASAQEATAALNRAKGFFEAILSRLPETLRE